MKKANILLRMLLAVAAVVLVVGVTTLILNWFPGARSSQMQRGVRGGAGALSWDALMPAANAEEAREETAEQPVQEDFLELYGINPHVVGWLKAGDRIDYPVVQHDNEYYLTHNFYGRKNSNGTLFLNMNNALIPRDDVLLIHGHNMKSGAMFGTLKKYMDRAYLRKYPVITFRTIHDTEDVYYTPIAAFNASMNPDNAKYFDITPMVFEDDPERPEDANGEQVRQSAAFQKYLDSLAEWSLWKPGTDVTVEDRLLALVTCSYYQDNGRFILVCRALRDDETPEKIEKAYQEEL